MLGVRLYSHGSRRCSGFGTRCSFGMLAVLASLVTFSLPATAAESSSAREALIASLEGLKKAVNDKVASDIEDVAWGLWSVHEIEEARFWADLLGAPLAVVQQAISTV